MAANTVCFDIRPTSTWRVDFRRAEMDFFDIPLTDWRTESRKKLKNLHPNYGQVHPFHVAWLNQRLPLADPLENGDFDGEITLIELRDTEVAQRIRVESAVRIELDADEDTLKDAGLAHLLSLPSRS